MTSILIHIVVYRSFPYLEHVLRSLRELEGDFEIALQVTENGPSEAANGGPDTLARLCEAFGAELFRESENIGFCGAHNAAAARCMAGGYDYLLIVNPDLSLEREALREMVRVSKEEQETQVDTPLIVAPLLFRADADLRPLKPLVIDSAGVCFTLTLRHFDILAGERYSGSEGISCCVEGVSGACFLISSESISAVVIGRNENNDSLFRVFPALEKDFFNRVELFDEAFFAYREDAELALRVQRLGGRSLIAPKAFGYHVRQVTPERRKDLSDEINRHSVRNRFLLQILHWSPFRQPEAIVPGFFIRNILVLCGVLFREWSSLRALRECAILFPRAWRRRKLMVLSAPEVRQDG
ncbi:glycosyltransferase family 2 protein [bacterium]|nr:glycosyltransferase family 2 protein [bacterium]